MRPVALISRVALVGAALAACAPRAPEPPPAPRAIAVTDARSLLAAMHQRYEGKWYSTLRYLQSNTRYTGNREVKDQWMKYVAVPGRMRIDYLPLRRRAGLLYSGGRVYTFDNGRQTSTSAGVNPMQVLTADVNVESPERTAGVLDSLGFDLTKYRSAEWQGRRVHVAGSAVAGDTTTSQFWVDADRLVVVRVIQSSRRGTQTLVTDTHLDRFIDEAGYPIATLVLQRRDGRLVFREEYSELKANDSLPAGLFDPSRWTETQIPRP